MFEIRTAVISDVHGNRWALEAVLLKVGGLKTLQYRMIGRLLPLWQRRMDAQTGRGGLERAGPIPPDISAEQEVDPARVGDWQTSEVYKAVSRRKCADASSFEPEIGHLETSEVLVAFAPVWFGQP